MIVGCAVNNPIVIDYDREAEFGDYNTFYWSDEFQQAQHPEVDNPLFFNTLNKKRLKKAIKKEMEGRGYKVASENPDLLVDARIVVDQKNQTTYTQNRYPYYYGWYGPNQQTTVSSSKEGGIIVEFIDKDEQQLIWQGYTPEVLELTTKDKEAQIQAAISGIFSEFQHRSDS